MNTVSLSPSPLSVAVIGLTASTPLEKSTIPWATSGFAFPRLFVAGLTGVILVHIIVNIGMTVGLVPVIGIPLPLISYGGTAMMTIMICLGLLMSIDRQTRLDPRRR